MSGNYSNSPGSDGAAVTKSDATILAPTRALYVGGTGDVVVKMKSGNIVTFPSVPAGAILPISVTQVRNATTATNIVAIF